MRSVFAAVLRRDLRLALRRTGDTVAAVTFFVIAVSLFPLGIGPDPAVVARIAAGTVWVAALLAAMLSLDRLFAADRDDGSLDLLLLAPAPTEVVVLAKCLAHWLASGVPVVVVAPLLALAMDLGPRAAAAAVLAMLLGTPVLSLLGAVGAALTVGVRRGGALVPLLVLPLAIPVLIFGAAAIDRAAAGGAVAAPFLMLGALLLAALTLAPWAAAAALRVAAE